MSEIYSEQFGREGLAGFDTRGEQLTENLGPEESQERQANLEKITESINAWIKEHIPEGETLTRERLGNLVKFLSNERRAEIDEIIKLCPDRAKYVDRPAIKLYDGEQGRSPDIWLLGWRDIPEEQEAEQTSIHDHVDSEAAFHVFRGGINETVFAINKGEYGENNSSLNFQLSERGFQEGSTATIGAPYIHIVSGIPNQELAVTIHAYYPPLEEMNFYEIKGDKLIKTGSWQEKPKPQVLHC